MSELTKKLSAEDKKKILQQYDKLGNALADHDYTRQECVLLGFCVGAGFPAEMFELMLAISRESQE